MEQPTDQHNQTSTPKQDDTQTQPQTPEASAPTLNQEPDDDDNIATAEDMDNFIRQRREQQRQKKESKNIASEEPIVGMPAENFADPYLDVDPKIPQVPYKDNPYITRGCTKCPEPYKPVHSCTRNSCCKLSVYNWLKGIHQPQQSQFDCVEVRFKNNHKDFYRLPDGISVAEGDLVAVEGAPGHDVGIVSITGELCHIQMKKKHIDPASENIKKLFRRAKAIDIEKWVEALHEENEALLKTRRISEELGLVMKVNDVEYQGDHSKATFYYTADERVDFRSLIKVLAEEFKVRIEMKQIGVRQEASKVGGLGTCGRELCCSTWLTNFKSVTTSVAKAQQILPNPQKLAGQCGKLKCCLNFEYEVYADALKKFPPANTPIRFQKGLALYKKTDVFRGIMWYAYEGENDLYAITAENVSALIEMNKRQEYPSQLEDYQVELMSTTALEQESSEQEFDIEIKRLADNGSEVVSEDHRRDTNHNARSNERQHRQSQRQNDNRNDNRRRQNRNEATENNHTGENDNRRRNDNSTHQQPHQNRQQDTNNGDRQRPNNNRQPRAQRDNRNRNSRSNNPQRKNEQQ